MNKERMNKEREKLKEQATIKGKLERCDVQGEEKPYFAISDSSVTDITNYADIFPVGNGDYLKIFDKKDPKQVVWEGKIDLEKTGLRQDDIQKDVDQKLWLRWFNQEFPAELALGDQSLNLFWKINNERIGQILNRISSPTASEDL